MRAGRITFIPSLSEVESMVCDTMDTFVQSVSGIPRVAIEAQCLNDGSFGTGTSVHGKPKTAIPCTTLKDDSIVQSRKVALILLPQ